MPRQRDYHAEYLARKERLYPARQERARERGFTGYGQERTARTQIAREYTRLVEKGIVPTAPAPGSKLMDNLLRAKAIILGYSKKTSRLADQKHEGLLGRTKEGRRLRDELRAALGYGKKDWTVYYPAMRALYASRRGH